MEGQVKKITMNSNSNNNNSNGNNHDMQNNNEISEHNIMKQFIEFNQNYQQHQQNLKNGHNINHNSTTIRHQNNKNSSSNSNISQKILDDWLENCIREQNYPFIQSNHLNGNNSINNNNNHSNNYDNNLQSIKMNKKYSSDVTSSSIRNHQPNHYHPQNHNHPSSSSQQNLLTVDYLCNGIGPNHLDKYRKNFHLTETSINQEFMSLPPGINLVQYNNSNGSNSNNNNNGCNSPKNSTITDGSNINNNINNNYSDILINEFEKSRRYSDPGLGGIAINYDEDDSKSSDNENLDKKFNTSGAATNTGTNNETNTKMLTLLLEQIHMLHETNTKICRNLQETKVEVEALKNAPPSWPHRHRKDSISGFSSHSQPLNYNMGNQSPMPTYQSGMYTPGLLTDVVREVREAARIREEALINRVRSLVDERQWVSNDNRLKIMKDVEDLKVQVLQLRTDKKDLHHQILQMETEIKSLKSFLTFALAQTQTINRPQPSFSSGGVNYQSHHISPHPHIAESVEQTYHHIDENCNDFPESVKRFANMNVTNGDGSGDDVFHNLNDSGGSSSTNSGFKNNNKIVVSSPDGQIINLERDNIQLRRELQNARTATSNSEYRIKKLENMVAMMQTKLKSDNQTTDTSQPTTVVAKSTPGTTNKISLSKILEHPKTLNPKPSELKMGIQVQDVTPYELHINHSGPVTDL